jgi:uncharacterized protein (DUF1015 family)
MPSVHPFHSLHYAAPRDLSALIAPPYDVLDSAGKQRLLAKDPRNIVAIDLPHTPAKELGPAAAYASAAARLHELRAGGTLIQTPQPCLFAYRQTWSQPDPAHPGSLITRSRSGMACCINTLPFGPHPGGGILPHEETFSGPKEDRMALMRATRTQLSPIFGLHADEHARARDVLVLVMSSREPDRIACTDDGTHHELWTIDDAPTIAAYQSALAGEDIFIADGHHRYTTGLNYLRELESRGELPPDHPARRTMIVLIGMSDPGLTIWPTHRVLGGMADYSFSRFLAESAGTLTIQPLADPSLAAIEHALAAADHSTPRGRALLGLYDFATGAAALAFPTHADPLARQFPYKPRAWRDLSVAFIQHAIVEHICAPKLNRGRPITWAFPHTMQEVADIGAGRETGSGGGSANSAQLAIIVQPTPLNAVRDVSRAGELMPQKSTFFYPKLATGLFMHCL